MGINVNFNGVPPLGIPPSVTEETPIPISPLVGFLQRVVDTLNEESVLQSFGQDPSKIHLQTPGFPENAANPAMGVLQSGKPITIMDMAMLISLAIQSLQEAIREAERADIEDKRSKSVDTESLNKVMNGVTSSTLLGRSNISYLLQRDYLPYRASLLPLFVFAASMQKAATDEIQNQSFVNALQGTTGWDAATSKSVVDGAFGRAKMQGPFSSTVDFLNAVKKELPVDNAQKDIIFAAALHEVRVTPFYPQLPTLTAASLLSRLPFENVIQQSLQNTLFLGPWATKEAFLNEFQQQLSLQLPALMAAVDQSQQLSSLFGLSPTFASVIFLNRSSLVDNFGQTLAQSLLEKMPSLEVSNYFQQSVFSTFLSRSLSVDLGFSPYSAQEISFNAVQSTVAKGPFLTDESFKLEYAKQLAFRLELSFVQRFFDPSPMDRLRGEAILMLVNSELKPTFEEVLKSGAHLSEAAFFYEVQQKLMNSLTQGPSEDFLAGLSATQNLVPLFQKGFNTTPEIALTIASQYVADSLLNQVNYSSYQALSILLPLQSNALNFGLSEVIQLNAQNERLSGFSIPVAGLINLAESIVLQGHLHQELVQNQNESLLAAMQNPEKIADYNASVLQNNALILKMNEERQKIGLPLIPLQENYSPDLSLLAQPPTIQESMATVFFPIKDAALSLVGLVMNNRLQETALSFMQLQNPAFIFPNLFISQLPPYFLGVAIQPKVNEALSAIAGGVGSVSFQNTLGQPLLENIALRLGVSLSPSFYLGVQLLVLETIQRQALISGLGGLSFLGSQSWGLDPDSKAFSVASSLSFAMGLADTSLNLGIGDLLLKEGGEVNPLVLDTFSQVVKLSLLNIALTRLSFSIGLPSLLPAVLNEVYGSFGEPKALNPIQDPIVQLYLKQAISYELSIATGLNPDLAALLANQQVNNFVVNNTPFSMQAQAVATLFLQAEMQMPYLGLAFPQEIVRASLLSALSVSLINDNVLSEALNTTLASDFLQTNRDFFITFTFALRSLGLPIEDAVAASRLAIDFFAGGKIASDVALEKLDGQKSISEIKEDLVNHLVNLFVNELGLMRATLLSHRIAVAILGAVKGSEFDSDPVASLKSLLKMLQMQLAALLSGEAPKILGDDMTGSLVSTTEGLQNPDPDLAYILQQLINPASTFADSVFSQGQDFTAPGSFV